MIRVRELSNGRCIGIAEYFAVGTTFSSKDPRVLFALWPFDETNKGEHIG
jgi:hypothetical protein